MKPSPKRTVKAFGVYSKDATHGIVWKPDSTFRPPLAIFSCEEDAKFYAKKINEGRRMYKVIPCTITYSLPTPRKKK